MTANKNRTFFIMDLLFLFCTFDTPEPKVFMDGVRDTSEFLCDLGHTLSWFKIRPSPHDPVFFISPEPTVCPFPDISGHVMDTVRAYPFFKTPYCCNLTPCLSSIGRLCLEFLSPGIFPASGPPGRFFPLLFGGETFSSPLTIFVCIKPGHLSYGVLSLF